MIAMTRWAGLLLLAGCAAGFREPATVPGASASGAVCDPEVLWSAAEDRFEAESWNEAIRAAERAERCGLDPGRSRDLKAAAMLLAGRADAALDLWEEPTPLIVSRVQVTGAERVSAAAVRRRAGLAPGDPLTVSAFRLAARRLADLPGVTRAAVRFAPSRSHQARVGLIVAERPRFVQLPWELAVRAATAAFRETIELTWSSPFDAGGAVSTLVRWQEGRPAWSIHAAGIPSPLPFRIDLRAAVSEETYAAGGLAGSPPPPRSRRTDAGVRVGDWVTPGLFVAFDLGRERFRAGSATDAWQLGARAELRSPDDRVRLAATFGTVLVNGEDVHTVTLETALRSARSFDPARWRYSIEAGVARVSDHAPMPLWPGAGVGRARQPLLRAHGLLDSGAIRVDRAFGRSLAHGSVEVASPARFLAGAWIAAAGFTDIARASRRADGLGTFAAWDLGGGLRVRTVFDLTARVDATVSLLDDSRAVSVGIRRPWDPWR